MPRFTKQWADAYNAKRMPAMVESAKADPRPESKIHEQILDCCKARNWYVVHSRMDMPSTNGVGVPDFIIATRTGTLWIEVKRRGGKPTPAQRAANYWLKTLGHKAHVVWSFEEFEQIARNEQ